MRDRVQLYTARCMAMAHESTPECTPDRLAVVYGMRVSLGVVMYFKLPGTKAGWDHLLQGICEAFHGRNSPYTPSLPKRPRSEPCTALDMQIFRDATRKVVDEYEIPPHHVAILAGCRISLAWALELPSGGRPLEQLMQGDTMDPAIPRVVNVTNFEVGVV